MKRADEGDFFARARNYWKFAPSGRGKVDTSALLALDDETFIREHDDHRISRKDHYWEDRYVVRHLSKMFAGKQILSFGSGIGHNEIEFLMHGATVVCADIVQSNLDVIKRACTIRGLANASFLHMENSAIQKFDGQFDHVFVRGSLMTMPAEMQRSALANMKQALAPGGYIILNLYTRAFLDGTTGIDDPLLFARASDPSVGAIHNPWSDWHDDRKLLDLAGDDMCVTHRQYWNQGWYVWYFLGRKSEHQTAAEPLIVCDADGQARAENDVLRPFTCDALELLGATRDASSVIETDVSKYGYVARSGIVASADLGGSPTGIFVDAEVMTGGLSIGILDSDHDRFAYSRAIWEPGRHRHYFSISRVAMPRRFRIVISNHRDGEPERSRFRLHSVNLIRRNGVE